MSTIFVNKNKEACFSHKTDHWKTPKEIYNKFIEYGYKDPCPYMSIEDNLNKEYQGENLFINPPYSNIDKWINFSIKHIEKNPINTIALLIPSRTDTKYFHKLLENENINILIYFFKGRLHFNDEKNGAPFPSILIFINWSLKSNTTIIKNWEKYLNWEKYTQEYIKQKYNQKLTTYNNSTQ